MYDLSFLGYPVKAGECWRKVLTKELIDTDDALSIRKTYVGGKWKLSRQDLVGGLQTKFNG